MHVCVRGGAGASRGQKRSSDPLELELLVVVSCLAWVCCWKQNSESPQEPHGSAFNHGDISPVPGSF